MFAKQTGRGGTLNDKEKNLLERISEKAEKLDPEDQQYLLGVAQGMSIMKARQEDSRAAEQLNN